MTNNVKVSGTNWLCVEVHGVWKPAFKLSQEQVREWKDVTTGIKTYPGGGSGTFTHLDYYRKSGEFRAPKKGEWYLSGAIPCAYQAPNDLLSAYHILVKDNT